MFTKVAKSVHKIYNKSRIRRCSGKIYRFFALCPLTLQYGAAIIL